MASSFSKPEPSRSPSRWFWHENAPNYTLLVCILSILGFKVLSPLSRIERAMLAKCLYFCGIKSSFLQQQQLMEPVASFFWLYSSADHCNTFTKMEQTTQVLAMWPGSFPISFKQHSMGKIADIRIGRMLSNSDEFFEKRDRGKVSPLVF